MKALVAALVLLAGVATAVLGLFGAPATAQSDQGRQLTAAHSGLCLTVQGASTAPASRVVQEECTRAPSQIWTPIDVGGGWFRLQVAHSGQCLNVEGASTADGARMIQFPCGPAANSEFRFEPTATEPGRIIARHSGKCVNIAGASTSRGGAAVQWPCTSEAANDLFATDDPNANPATVGRWGPVIPLPLVPAAVSNLPDGRVLMWSAFGRDEFGGDRGFTQTAIFDPARSTSTVREIRNTGHDMFCPGTAHLPDGRILINGGSSAEDTTIYDPATDTWTAAADMNIPRGYQGTTLTSDGSVLTLGGSWSGARGGKDGELWTENGGWRRLSGVPIAPFRGTDPEGVYRDDNHLWLFAWKDGTVFHAGPSRQMNWIDTNGNGSVRPAGNRASDVYAMNGTAVMYAPGRILTAGGAPAYENGVATANVTTIDINGPTAIARAVAPMANPRVFHNSVVLPNGEVVVTGGQAVARVFRDDDSVFPTEIWSPSTQRFRTVSSLTVPRNYHSVSLLMTDGRVLVGGGGLCDSPTCPTNHLNGQIFSPPYLFNSDGSEATRPRIISAPESVDLEEVFTVSTNTAVSEMVLVRLSTATHSVNNDQRRIPLEFAPGSGNLTWRVTAPSDPGVALPGLYMLFALDANGVPSVSEVVQVTSEVADNNPAVITGAVTNSDGSPVADAAVDLFTANPDGSRGAFIGSTTTGTDGRYRFDVAPGCYSITFIAPTGRTFTNGSRWLQTSPCPTSGQTSTADAQLIGGGVNGATIDGTVTDLGDEPQPGIAVDLFTSLADGSRGSWLAATTTDTNGRYRFEVTAGCHTITFIAPTGTTFTNGSRWYSQNTCPTPGQTSTVNARLASGATGTGLTGIIINNNGTRANGLAVDLFTANPDGSRGAYLTSTTTALNGTYQFNTPTGCHIITAVAPDGRTFTNGTRWTSLTGCPTTGQTITLPITRLN